ncbi:hypothetical protein BKA56DRAFT_710517 [Ilyonectria sp. MPI-CAGE-AT-0026]|nr:hypothetical protein BKA56DRAFT_710517 [Ilyonectria sp. MPI-CAGE-AT-0026]
MGCICIWGSARPGDRRPRSGNRQQYNKAKCGAGNDFPLPDRRKLPVAGRRQDFLDVYHKTQNYRTPSAQRQGVSPFHLQQPTKTDSGYIGLLSLYIPFFPSSAFKQLDFLAFELSTIREMSPMFLSEELQNGEANHAHHIANLLQGPLHFGMLLNESGTGKTFTAALALKFVIESNINKSQDAADICPPRREEAFNELTTLWNGVFDVWCLYHSRDNCTNPERKTKTLDNASQLQKLINKLARASDNPKSARQLQVLDTAPPLYTMTNRFTDRPSSDYHLIRHRRLFSMDTGEAVPNVGAVPSSQATAGTSQEAQLNFGVHRKGVWWPSIIAIRRSWRSRSTAQRTFSANSPAGFATKKKAVEEHINEPEECRPL